MSDQHDSVDRRDFLKTAGGVGLTLSMAGSALAARGGKSAASNARVLGANDRINVAAIGVASRSVGCLGRAECDAEGWLAPPRHAGDARHRLDHPARAGARRTPSPRRSRRYPGLRAL